MKQHDIILIANEPWEHFTWRRRHNVAWILAKENRVLFVEPPFSLVSPLRDRNVNWRQLLNLGRLKHQGRNLYSYSPLKLFPSSLSFSSRLDFDAINRKSVYCQLRHCAQRLRIRNPILWVFFSDKQYEYYSLFDQRITVGDFYDKFTTPTWDGMLPEHIEQLRQKQNAILRKSDIVFTVSKLLSDEFRQFHDKVFVVPNGVEYETFEKCNSAPISAATNARIKKPVIGFLGMMHYKVDFELLDYLAKSRPEWTLLLMGKDNINTKSDRLVFERLRRYDNVVWTGEIERAFIPHFLNLVDVSIVPLKKIELNKYANYLKVWEYLAAGKPIVSVEQGIPSEYPDLVRFADSKEEFIDNIEKAMKEDVGEKLVKRRKDVALSNSWDSRVQQMLEIIEGSLPKVGHD